MFDMQNRGFTANLYGELKNENVLPSDENMLNIRHGVIYFD